MEERLLCGLNDAQKEAVLAGDEPILLLSGAGTGKTKVLTSRIAHLITHRGVSTHNIIAVTFSNKASNEMKERLANMLEGYQLPSWMGTFHSMCVRILRAHGEAIGIEHNFSVIDHDDQIRLMKQILTNNNIDKKLAPAILNKISLCKDKALHSQSKHLDMFLKRGYEHKIYQEYQNQLSINNALDFGDLILSCIRLFQQSSEVLHEYRERFVYMLVDEYQDTNLAQYIWMKLLKTDGRGLCCVGDDDQSIYSWRGAEVRNIIKFQDEFNNARIIRLEQNYRSSGHILGAASSLIAHNTERLPKTLWTADGDGTKPVVSIYNTGFDEAKHIVNTIVQYHSRGVSFSQIAILIRAGFQSREFEEMLNVSGVPYHIVGGMRFYERKEIKDIIAYLRLIYQKNDNLAFMRAISVPKRGIGESALSTLHQIASEHDISLFNAAQMAIKTPSLLRPTTYKSLNMFVDLILNCTHDLPQEIASYVVEESGYRKMLQSDKEAQAHLENIDELINALGEFLTLGEFLEHVSLVMDLGQKTTLDSVTIMTLHASKGLEFETVFLCGWEEGVFPHDLSIQENNIEEERRLAYVGITRAKRYAHISYAINRRVHNQWRSNLPSRFIKEIDHRHVHVINNIDITRRREYGG